MHDFMLRHWSAINAIGKTLDGCGGKHEIVELDTSD
jgi:hypothetical protein